MNIGKPTAFKLPRKYGEDRIKEFNRFKSLVSTPAGNFYYFKLNTRIEDELEVGCVSLLFSEMEICLMIIDQIMSDPNFIRWYS